MKFALALAALAATAQALSEEASSMLLSERFEAFKAEHGKTYTGAEHKERMETAIASCDPTNPMAKMQTLIPIVQEIQGTVMAKYGFEGPGAVMAATMQINMFAPQDPEIANGVRMLAAKLSGN